jgi:hypothetical protein
MVLELASVPAIDTRGLRAMIEHHISARRSEIAVLLNLNLSLNCCREGVARRHPFRSVRMTCAPSASWGSPLVPELHSQVRELAVPDTGERFMV